MRFLVDSDYRIDAAGGISAAVRTLDHLSPQGLAVRIIAVGDVYEGAFGLAASEAKLANFCQFLSGYAVLPLTDPIVERFARTQAALRRQVWSIPDLVLLIAATAVEHDLIVVTRHRRHFAGIPDLRLFPAT